jgi:serine protease Do
MERFRMSTEFRFPHIELLLVALLCTFSLAQQPGNGVRNAKSPDKSKAASAPAAEIHADSPDILRQMNRALEDLAAQVSPAVVQIQTSGYGPLHESESDSGRGQTALIVRQHAVGSGVIVDSNGYIMTNAHLATT